METNRLLLGVCGWSANWLQLNLSEVMDGRENEAEEQRHHSRVNAVLAVNSIPFVVLTAKRELSVAAETRRSTDLELDSVYSACTGLFGRLRFPSSKLSCQRVVDS